MCVCLFLLDLAGVSEQHVCSGRHVQQGDDPLGHGGWQAGGKLSLEGILQHCQQLWAEQVPELSVKLIWQAV